MTTLTVLHNARIVDGSGGPSQAGDLHLADGRIVAVGRVGVPPGAEVIDLDGLVVAPGFIDVHTHYDAQILSDSKVTPSSWNGVTSVLMGNCGYAVAPLRADDRQAVQAMLCAVEGIPPAAVDLDGVSFDSVAAYMEAVGALRPTLNVGVMVGHSALRVFVMGADAWERPATDEEIRDMQDVLRAAIANGAIGFATSRAPGHEGPPGRPVPSRVATPEEVFRLGDVLGEMGIGIVQVDPGPDLFLEELAYLADRCQRPVSWAALLARMQDFGAARAPAGHALELLEQAGKLSGAVWPQVSGRPLVISFGLAEPYALRRLPAFAEILGDSPAVRRQRYEDPGWRSRAAVDLERWSDRWERVRVQGPPALAAATDGRSLSELAAAEGTRPGELMIDLALRSNFEARFVVSLFNDDPEEVGTLLRDPRTVLGLSDAGAHVDQFCDAAFGPHLLGTWVRRRQVLTLEQACWRLSGQPAEVFGLRDRGLLREGFAADVVAFDPEVIDELPLERRNDLPGGGARFVARSTGIAGVWVNGVRIVDSDELCDVPGPGQIVLPKG